MIIGIHGRKQSGKDSITKFISELLPEKKIRQIALAKHLKDFVHEAFNISKQHLYGSDADKDYPLCTWGDIFTQKALEAYKKRDRDLLSAREILQLVGTDVMRYGHMDYLLLSFKSKVATFLIKKFGPEHNIDEEYPDIWVDLAAMDIKILKARRELDIAVISDMRFVNEFNMVKKNSGITIRLYRDTRCKESIVHASERDLEEIEDSSFDYVLYEHENRNLKQLKTFATRVLMSEQLIPVGGIAI